MPIRTQSTIRRMIAYDLSSFELISFIRTAKSMNYKFPEDREDITLRPDRIMIEALLDKSNEALEKIYNKWVKAGNPGVKSSRRCSGTYKN